MRRQEMTAKCTKLLDRFDQLEALLEHIPKPHHAFVFCGAQALHELLTIAKFETATRATPEQAIHLRQLDTDSRRLLADVPRKVRDELEDG